MKHLVENSKVFKIIEDGDRDLHICIYDYSPDNGGVKSFEFCTPGFGGGNIEIYNAVMNLKRAIEKNGVE